MLQNKLMKANIDSDVTIDWCYLIELEVYQTSNCDYSVKFE